MKLNPLQLHVIGYIANFYSYPTLTHHTVEINLIGMVSVNEVSVVKVVLHNAFILSILTEVVFYFSE